MSELFFDTIYIINLKRRPDKLKKVQRRIKTIGLDRLCDVQVIDAFDGKTLSDTYLQNNVKIPTEYFDPMFGRGMTKGEIGCALSHNYCWRLASKNEGNTLIIEDDAVFVDDFIERVKSFQRGLDEIHWELFYLGRFKKDQREEEIIYDEVVYPYFSYWCLAYVLTPNGARKLYNSNYLNNLIPSDEFVPIMLGTPNPNLSYITHRYKDNDTLTGLALSNNVINPEVHAFDNSETEKTEVYFRENSYNDGIDRFMVITVATEDNDALERFRQSCHYYNIPYKILGLGQEWTGGEAANGVLLKPGGAQKINLLKEELKTYPDLGNHIIMFTDSYDVVFNDNPKNIVRKFRDMKSAVVFSAEKTCWPDGRLETQYPISPTDYKFLNSGGFIGYGDHINEIINKVEVQNDYDDQLYYTERFFESLGDKKNIILDYTQEIFQTLGDATDDVEVDDQGILNNKVTKTTPSVVHGNGGSYVKNFLNEIGVMMFGQFSQGYGSKQSMDKKEYDDTKVVNIGLFLDEEIGDINQAFDHIRFLEYPKENINLWVYYTNKKHSYKVDLFKEKYSHLYRNFVPIMHYGSRIWSRKDFLIESFNNCDYVMLMESNHIFRNRKGLKMLIDEGNLIVSPMICKEGSTWVNFDMASQEIKENVRVYKQRNIWNVKYTFGIHLIKNSVIPYCVNGLKNNDKGFTELDWDILMCEKLSERGYYIKLSNMNYYGGII